MRQLNCPCCAQNTFVLILTSLGQTCTFPGFHPLTQSTLRRKCLNNGPPSIHKSTTNVHHWHMLAHKHTWLKKKKGEEWYKWYNSHWVYKEVTVKSTWKMSCFFHCSPWCINTARCVAEKRQHFWQQNGLNVIFSVFKYKLPISASFTAKLSYRYFSKAMMAETERDEWQNEEITNLCIICCSTRCAEHKMLTLGL